MIDKRMIAVILACAMIGLVFGNCFGFLLSGKRECLRFERISKEQAAQAGIYGSASPGSFDDPIYVDTLTGYLYTEHGQLIDEDGYFAKISQYEE